MLIKRNISYFNHNFKNYSYNINSNINERLTNFIELYLNEKYGKNIMIKGYTNIIIWFKIILFILRIFAFFIIYLNPSKLIYLIKSIFLFIFSSLNIILDFLF